MGRTDRKNEWEQGTVKTVYRQTSLPSLLSQGLREGVWSPVSCVIVIRRDRPLTESWSTQKEDSVLSLESTLFFCRIEPRVRSFQYFCRWCRIHLTWCLGVQTPFSNVHLLMLSCKIRGSSSTSLWGLFNSVNFRKYIYPFNFLGVSLIFFLRIGLFWTFLESEREVGPWFWVLYWIIGSYLESPPLKKVCMLKVMLLLFSVPYVSLSVCLG